MQATSAVFNCVCTKLTSFALISASRANTEFLETSTADLSPKLLITAEFKNQTVESFSAWNPISTVLSPGVNCSNAGISYRLDGSFIS